MTETVFTLAGYRALIEAFLERGYRSAPFDAAAQPGERQLLLRHDVDYSLASARRMAELERDLGVCTTYFILARSPLFNPLGLGDLEELDALAATGARIGLHFDASMYPDAGPEALEVAAAREARTLGALLGFEIKALSFHRPPAPLRRVEGLYAGCFQTSDPRFTEAIPYCSDSMGAFRFGEPLDHDAVTVGRALHLLTHPIWWDGYPGEDGIAKLDRLRAERGARFDINLARSVKPYAERAIARLEEIDRLERKETTA